MTDYDTIMNMNSAGECSACKEPVIVRDTRPGPTCGLCLACMHLRATIEKTAFEKRITRFQMDRPPSMEDIKILAPSMSKNR